MFWRQTMLCNCLAFILPALTQAQSRPGIVRPAEGEPFSARLTTLDKDGNFTFDAKGQVQRLAAGNLISFGAWADGEKGPLVILADGSTLVVNALEQLSGQHLHVAAEPWGAVRLPLASVRGVIVRPPADPLVRDKLYERVLATKGDEDQLLLDNGDLISGLLKGAPAPPEPPPDAEPGALKNVHLQTKAGPADVGLDKLLAIIFNPALVETPSERGKLTWFGFRGGSCLMIAQAETVDGATRLTLSGGQTLSADAAELLDDIVWVQPLGGAIYLSDLKPAGYKHIPFLERTWSYGADRNVLGGRLRSGNVVYAKGLSMHSTARLAYRLDGRYRRFAAELALDDQAGSRGSVTYRVFVEREANDWQPAYESPVVRGGDAPVPISVDIAGALRLALIVEFADRGDELDYANWLNARLIK